MQDVAEKAIQGPCDQAFAYYMHVGPAASEDVYMHSLPMQQSTNMPIQLSSCKLCQFWVVENADCVNLGLSRGGLQGVLLPHSQARQP